MTAALYVADVATEFGEWLDSRMLDMGLSQAELSKVSGISESQLSRYRRGPTIPDPGTLRTLAPHLDASFDAMMVLAGHSVGDADDAAKTYVVRTEDPKIHRLIRMAKAAGEGVQPGDFALIENLLKTIKQHKR